MDTQAANRIWLSTQPRHYTTCEKIPLSRQLLKMGTRWPETCWATYKEQLIRRNKYNTKWHLVGSYSILNYAARSTTHQKYMYTYTMLIIPSLCRRGRHIATNSSWIFENNDKFEKWKRLISETESWVNEVPYLLYEEVRFSVWRHTDWGFYLVLKS